MASAHSRLLEILRRLKKLLEYRLDHDQISKPGDDIFIDEEVFFNSLFVPLAELQEECLAHLIHYGKPVLLLGKQGVGKTTILAWVLRELAKSIPVTTISIRCSPELGHYFQDIHSLIALFRVKYEFRLALEETTLFDLFEEAIKSTPEFLTNSNDPSRLRKNPEFSLAV